MCICIADSLCCGAGANTPLWGSYTPVKMFKKKTKNHQGTSEGVSSGKWQKNFELER